MTKVKIVIPKKYLRASRKQKGTKAIQGPDGKLLGRKAFKSGKGDSTKVRYLKEDFDINQDGKISENEKAGRLFGRTVKVRGNRGRATIRRF